VLDPAFAAVPTARPIARIAAGDRDAFAHAEAAGTPVVVEGGARDWPATARWSVAYLTELVGALEVDHKVSATGAHPDFTAASMAQMFARGRGTLAELFAAMTSGSPDERARRLFTGDEQFLLRRRDGVTTLHAPFAPLFADVVVPNVIPAESLYTVWAWFSGAGARTWLHYDNNGCHNLNAQLTGAKAFVLFAPDQLAALAPFPLGGPNPAHNCSALDVFAAATAFAGPVDAIAGELAAGDLLFLPAWWSHAFVHRGDFNANVNFWWKPARPLLDRTAARQALVDAAAAAGLTRDPGAADALRRLDRAALETPG
jgi:hypothetical protein